MRRAFIFAVICCTGLRAVELKPETVQAFDRYIQTVESRLNQPVAQVRQGELAIENLTGGGPKPVPGGLIHDWIGSVFVPGVTLARTIAFLQDYDHSQDYYKPEVLASRLISRHGDDFKIHMRVMKKKVITVILDTDYDVHYSPVSGTRCQSRAYSTRIAEVQNAGKPDERTLPPGHDSGYLWRLYSYWKFEERDGGVYLECEAISLTRAIPAGLGWLVGPIVTSLPRESLANTLLKARAGLKH